jgi:signal transduction histidine kinase
MSQLQDELDQLDARMGTELAQRRAQSESSALTTAIVNGVAGVLILVLGATVAVLVRRYLTELKDAQAAIDRVNAGLEETVRARTAALIRSNEEVQRFAYIVSHDLRSPLVNVMGYTAELEQAGKTIDLQMTKVETLAPDLVERDALLAAREDIPEAVGFIRASTEKMDRLINAILRLSREGRRNLVPEMLDMAAMTERIADTVRHQLEATETDFVVGEMVPFESDRLSMEQIVGNLVDNAVKYLQPGRPGRIEITGHDLPGGWVEYAIADNGRGIAAKDHERIFELFRRAGRQDQKGEGLGLAFVRNSVRRLGGSIEVESELGEGSTFRLKFPKRLILDDAGEPQ